MRKGSNGKNEEKYQSSGARGSRSPPATPHRLLSQKWRTGDPKWPTGSGKGSNLGYWALNKFFDLSTPSMRKGRDGENEKVKK